MTLHTSPLFESLLPPTAPKIFDKFVADIRENGQLIPFTVDQDELVIDGNRRFRACSILKITPNYITKHFKSEDERIIFAIKSNLKRRHLNSFQIFELGKILHKIESKKANQRKLSSLKNNPSSASHDASDKGKTSSKMAAELGLSTSTYERCIKIDKSPNEKLKDRTRRGIIPTNTAYSKVVKESKPKFPELHPLIPPEIKSPLNVLWYNMNYEFKDKYPAKMSEDFARDMIKMYSNADDIVFDGFCGSGIVVREAQRLGRQGFGIDINPKAIELCKAHAKVSKLPFSYEVGDVRKYNLEKSNSKLSKLSKADLILSSPPFGLNIIGDKNNYSDENLDLSNSDSFDDFLSEMKIVIQNYYDNLKPNGIMILDARDRTQEGRYWDLINYFRNISLDVGFKLQCRYMYFLMPWSHYTYNNRDTQKVMPMISSMDAIVMYKP